MLFQLLTSLVFVAGATMTLLAAAAYKGYYGGNLQQPDNLNAHRIQKRGEHFCLWPHKVGGYYCWLVAAVAQYLAGFCCIFCASQRAPWWALVLAIVLATIARSEENCWSRPARKMRMRRDY